jgi:excisionase family DNA binding protein
MSDPPALPEDFTNKNRSIKMEQKQTVEKLLSPADLAHILGLKKSCIYRMLSTGEIPSVIVTNGGRKRSFRVRPSLLEKWLKRREVSYNETI